MGCGVGAGVGAGIGLGVVIGKVGEGAFGFGGAVVGSGGSVAIWSPALIVDGARVGAGVDRAIEGGVGVLGAGTFPPRDVTVVEDPAGTETSTPPALVSTAPLIVTIVVSPLGDTETYESDPARMTEAIPALRTS